MDRRPVAQAGAIYIEFVSLHTKRDRRFVRTVGRFEVSPVLPYPRSATPDATASAFVLADFIWRIDP